MLDLAQLMLEPLHRPDTAMVLAETELVGSPDDDRAVTLAAFAAIRHASEPSRVPTALGRLQNVPVPRSAPYFAAAQSVDR